MKGAVDSPRPFRLAGVKASRARVIYALSLLRTPGAPANGYFLL